MTTFYDAIHKSILNHVPIAYYRPSNFPVWFSKELIDIVTRKRKAHALYKTSGSPQDYRCFSYLRAKFKYISNKCYKAFVERTEAEFCTNPKRFWDFVRRNKDGNTIPKQVSLNEKHSNNEFDTANFFSEHFSSIYDENRVPTCPNYRLTCSSTFQIIVISTLAMSSTVCHYYVIRNLLVQTTFLVILLSL